MEYISWPEALVSPSVSQTLRLMQLVQRRGGVLRDRQTGTYLVASHDAVIECATSPNMIRAPGTHNAVRDAGNRSIELITNLTSALDGEQHACARRATRAGIANASFDVDQLFKQAWSATRSNVNADFDVAADFALPIAHLVANTTSGLAARSGTGLSHLMSEAFTDTSIDTAALDQTSAQLLQEASDALNEPLPNSSVDHLATARRNGDIDETTALGATTFASLSAVETLSSALTTLVAAIHVSDPLAELARINPARLVSEALRLTATVQMFHFDTTSDLVVTDVKIPRGSRVLVHYGAACRDPTRFERPHEVAVAPRPTDVAFSRGTHSCLGASLTRQFARAAVDVAVANPRSSKLLQADTAWSSSVFIHTPISCRLF